MAASTAKKVIVRRFDRENLSGFVSAYSYLQATAVELLKQDGALALLPYDEVRSVYVSSKTSTPGPIRHVFF